MRAVTINCKLILPGLICIKKNDLLDVTDNSIKKISLWLFGNTTDDRANTKGLISRTARKKDML